MNLCKLDDETSWNFIKEVLKTADWTEEEIQNIDQQQLTEVVEVINKHLIESSNDPKSPLSQYDELMELIVSYPIETKMLSDRIIEYTETGGQLDMKSVINTFNKNELAFFKKVANIVGEEEAIEAFKYAFSQEED